MGESGLLGGEPTRVTGAASESDVTTMLGFLMGLGLDEGLAPGLAPGLAHGLAPGLTPGLALLTSNVFCFCKRGLDLGLDGKPYVFESGVLSFTYSMIAWFYLLQKVRN